MDDEADELEVEARWLVELGNALNVTGDLSIGAARRLRAARGNAAELAELRARLAGSLRRVLSAGGIALALLEEGGVGP
jgi:hypothetical protein